uniref:Uncharacterized protein n=1 Tax=Fusarium oxysporum (strain Fo5176) TaxID=660025 RepID=A0A0D2YCX7_FUSOF
MAKSSGNGCGSWSFSGRRKRPWISYPGWREIKRVLSIMEVSFRGYASSKWEIAADEGQNGMHEGQRIGVFPAAKDLRNRPGCKVKRKLEYLIRGSLGDCAPIHSDVSLFGLFGHGPHKSC